MSAIDEPEDLFADLFADLFKDAALQAPDLGPIDSPLEAVVADLLGRSDARRAFGDTLRQTFDQIYDGGRTGRWDYQQLHKTEKTHMGTLVEINLHKRFAFADGIVTDYKIAGHEVDCKFSRMIGGWMLGPEMVGQMCLLVWANDEQSAWQVGVIRAELAVLSRGTNRDAKKTLRREAWPRIRWLWGTPNDLPDNLLLHLPAVVRDRIMGAAGARGPTNGTARLNQLCREVQGTILRRSVIETVGHGLDDPLKRMRGAGGAREWLRPEGILVLGHQDHDPDVARSLGLSVPAKGEFLAVRVAPAAGHWHGPRVQLAGADWRVARSDDPVVAAPQVTR